MRARLFTTITVLLLAITFTSHGNNSKHPFKAWLISPNPDGGDTLEIGKEFVVKWDDSNDHPNVRDSAVISVRVSATDPWVEIGMVRPTNTTKEFKWTPTAQQVKPSATCQMRIVCYSGVESAKGTAEMKAGKTFAVKQGVSINPITNNSKLSTSLKVYNNRIQFSQKVSNVKVFDSKGILVKSVNNPKGAVTLKDFSMGTYFVRFSVKSQNFVQKIVLQ